MRRHAPQPSRARGIARAAGALGLTAGTTLVALAVTGAVTGGSALPGFLPVSVAEADPLPEAGTSPIDLGDRVQDASRGQARLPLAEDIASGTDPLAQRLAEVEASRLAGLAQEHAERQAAAEAQRVEAERIAAEQAAAAVTAEAERAAAEAAALAAAYNVTPGTNRALAAAMIAEYGWGASQFECLDVLWQRESNWNHLAENPSSGAYGIPQSLPANKMASVAADWATNPATQISWGLGYIGDRYGTPCSAWSFWQNNNWY